MTRKTRRPSAARTPTAAALPWPATAGGTALLLHAVIFGVHRLIPTVGSGWAYLGIATVMAPLLVATVDRRALVTAGAAAATVLAVYATLLANWPPIFDRAWDSYMYHIFGTLRFVDGWDVFAHGSESIWVDSYPNAPWVLASVLVSAGDEIFAAHALTPVMTLATGVFAAGALSAGLGRTGPRWPVGLTVAIAVMNPIVVNQLLTYYVDGLLYLLGVALAASSMAFAATGRPFYAVIGCGVIALAVNTKTSGLYFVPAITAVGVIVGVTARGAPLSHLASALVHRALPFATAFVIAVGALGYRPFVTNVLDHGQVLYPAPDQVLRGQVPENLSGFPAPAKFVAGLFAKTGHIPRDDRRMIFKRPGSLQPGEIRAMSYDTRGGGFGPFFSVAVLAWLALCTTAVGQRLFGSSRRRLPREQAPDFRAVVVSLGLMVVCAFFPQPWWARYVPFAWLAVSLGLLAPTPRSSLLGVIWAAGLKTVLATALVACGVTAGYATWINTKAYQTYIAERLDRLAQADAIAFYAAPQDTDEGYNHATLVWRELLARRGITATVARHGACPLEPADRQAEMIKGRLTARARYCARYTAPGRAEADTGRR